MRGMASIFYEETAEAEAVYFRGREAAAPK